MNTEVHYTCQKHAGIMTKINGMVFSLSASPLRSPRYTLTQSPWFVQEERGREVDLSEGNEYLLCLLTLSSSLHPCRKSTNSRALFFVHCNVYQQIPSLLFRSLPKRRKMCVRVLCLYIYMVAIGIKINRGIFSCHGSCNMPRGMFRDFRSE